MSLEAREEYLILLERIFMMDDPPEEILSSMDFIWKRLDSSDIEYIEQFLKELRKEQ